MHSQQFNGSQLPGADFWQIQGTTIVGERGQVVIPAAVRADLGINRGDRMVIFSEKQHGVVTIVKAEAVNQLSKLILNMIGVLDEEVERILSDTPNSPQQTAANSELEE